MAAIHLGVAILIASAWFCEAADPEPDSEKKVVCYYTTWSHGRAAPFDFTPNKIDPFLCTHIIYAFADIGPKNNLAPADPEFDLTNRAFANITGLKKKNKNLKVMVSIGGFVEGTLKFAQISANETNRKQFAQNAVRFLRGYQFDGLDLNWQHPTFREGGRPEDKENYVLLSKALREEFQKESEEKNKPRLLLSIAISHNLKFLPAYDITGFNKYMDFISVICYDYHFSYEAAVYHHSPLYSLEEDNEYNYDAAANINFTINHFMKSAPPEKLVLGIPLYGRSYKLENPEDTDIGSAADGAGNGGPDLKNSGFAAYFEICNFVKTENWTVVQPKPGSVGPYAFKGDQWISYDDVKMIGHKVDFVKQHHLAGVMFWTLDYDDFLPRCQDTTFPMIRAARDGLISSAVPKPNNNDGPNKRETESHSAAIKQEHNKPKKNCITKPSQLAALSNSPIPVSRIAPPQTNPKSPKRVDLTEDSDAE